MGGYLTRHVQMNKIILGDCLDVLPTIPDASIDLVIADPPYFKVISEKWDYQWRTEEDYVSWCEKWIREVARVTKRTATFYLFGYIHALAKLIPVVERYGFEFRQQIVIDKGKQAIAGRHTSTYKMFPTVTESILFFVKDARPYVKELLKDAQKKSGLTAKQINEGMGVKSNGGGMWTFYQGDNILASIPTEEAWEKMQEILSIDVPYREVSFTFNREMDITDVWSDIDFYSGKKGGGRKRAHSTQKPMKLTRRLIEASSDKNDVVLDPFAGSGAICRSAGVLGRRFIGIEKDEGHHRRASDLVSQPTLLDFVDPQ